MYSLLRNLHPPLWQMLYQSRIPNFCATMLHLLTLQILLEICAAVMCTKYACLQIQVHSRTHAQFVSPILKLRNANWLILRTILDLTQSSVCLDGINATRYPLTVSYYPLVSSPGDTIFWLAFLVALLLPILGSGGSQYRNVSSLYSMQSIAHSLSVPGSVSPEKADTVGGFVPVGRLTRSPGEIPMACLCWALAR